MARAHDAAGYAGSSALVTVTVSNSVIVNQTYGVYDEENPSGFTGGWGWDGFQASRTSSVAYNGSYSYAVTVPSSLTYSSEGWTGPLPDTTGTTQLVFAYRKSNPSSTMILYFYVNGYWHQVIEDAGHEYQGWTIPKAGDTLWHEVLIDLSAEVQGTNTNPNVAPVGQMSNFEIAVSSANPGDSIYFDSIRFKKVVESVDAIP